jgi:hypothetical protein
MSNAIITIPPQLAQTPEAAAQDSQSSSQIWMAGTGLLFVLLIGLAIYSKMQMDKLKKQARFEEFKNRELKKKLKLALKTITRMETNPDLVHSREFNLDYLRMRMDEEVFHFYILNQLKMKVKQRISIALRSGSPSASQGVVGIASAGRQIDEMFDVEYEPGDAPKGTKRILFRIQIRLMKLPTQATSTTISQIIDCIETFLSPNADHDTWQPTIQGRIASMHWDQKAKPTPLLVLEQSNEGVNVTFRTTRRMAPKQ